MWEYKREETRIGSYNPSRFMQLLNNYAKDGWELVDIGNRHLNQRIINLEWL